MKWNGEVIEAEFNYPGELPVFDGHFPDYPIVPGAYCFGIVVYLLKKTLGLPPVPWMIKKAKFSSPIQPSKKIKIIIKLNMEKGKLVSLKANFKNNGLDLANLKIHFNDQS